MGRKRSIFWGWVVLSVFCLGLLSVGRTQGYEEKLRKEHPHKRGGGALRDELRQALSSEAQESLRNRAAQISTVNIIFMNHLDVGYNGIYPEIGFAYNVINTYFDVYFPAALNTSRYLRKHGGPERLIYTSHPWLISLYLDCPPNMNLHCPNSSALEAFVEGIKMGDITWHAGPFNLQPENMDATLFTYGLTIAEDLSNQFGLPKVRTLSQRDVPGMTRGVIPLLNSSGIVAVSVGVNGATAPPAVPNAFVWRDQASNTEVLAIWHPGGYPNNPGPNATFPGGLSLADCVMVDGLDTALAFAFKTDNSGPPSAEEVFTDYAILSAEFPNAIIVASTFDDFIDQLQTVRDTLPVVEGEIGDVWLEGISSDPLKEAQFREISRARVDCINSGACNLTDPTFKNFSRLLLKIPEHTWGLPGVYDNGNWSNTQFEVARSGENYYNCTWAWVEQRNYINYALEALGTDSPLLEDIQQRLEAMKPRYPDLTGFTVVNPTSVQRCDSIDITFDSQGTIISLVDTQNGIQWATSYAPWAELIYSTFNQTDFDLLESYFDYDGGNPGFYKINVSEAGAQSRQWRPSQVGLWRSTDSNCTFLQRLAMPTETVLLYGAPEEIWEWINIDGTEEVEMSIDLQWFNKTTTRLPESFMFAFRPKFEGWAWYMDKLGSLISPMDVIINGSQHQHGIWSGIVYVPEDDGYHGVEEATTKPRKIEIESLDVPVVSPGPETPYPTLAPLVEEPYGMAFNLYNNIWDTNYILWYPYLDEDANARFRFRAKLYTN